MTYTKGFSENKNAIFRGVFSPEVGVPLQSIKQVMTFCQNIGPTCTLQNIYGSGALLLKLKELGRLEKIQIK